MHTDSDVLSRALTWYDEGRGVALATVVETWGSAPRRPGSHMVVDDEGRFVGSVSGGCVEVAVVDEARAVLGDGRPRDLTYGVADAEAWAVGLACGGAIRVLIHPVGDGPGACPPGLLRAASRVGPGDDGLILALDLRGGGVADAGLRADLPESELREVRRGGGGRVLDGADGPVFVRPYLPPVRIVLVGAVHIAQPLAALARVAGYDVSVLDPRSDFASPDRFPGVALVPSWPTEGLEALDVDGRTAVVALTHDPKLDDPALVHAVRSRAFYVGALGSRRTHARRRERLGEAGLTPRELDRIRAPVGLDLGGRAPEEIAVSILAEIVGVLRGGGAVRGG